MSTVTDYKVIVVLTIFNSDRSRCARGHKEFVLPFVPYPGLSLTENFDHSCTIDSVTWCSENMYFHCYSASQESFSVDMDFLIDEAKENGWIGFNKIFDIDI